MNNLRIIDKIKSFLIINKKHILAIIIIFAIVAIGESLLGRSIFGPDGKFGLWASDIWSSANSQRVADPYSLTHIAHGFLFYFLLWIFARKLPMKTRLILAIFIEGTWEVLENSPLIIDYYRTATISIGYIGDSILNSLSDIVFAGIGFFTASRSRPYMGLVLFILLEMICLLWVRDNLTLNIIMFIYPFEGIKSWQSIGHII